MQRLLSLMCAAGAAALLVTPAAQASGNHGNGGNVQAQCSARTKVNYGFVCTGQAAVSAAGLEPVTFLGSVSGSNSGRFTGTGTFSSSLGSARQRVDGQAVFNDRSCAGSIRYSVFLLIPGGEVPLPDLDINFITSQDGDEILGVPYSPTGTGVAVPRLSCRLIKVGRD